MSSYEQIIWSTNDIWTYQNKTNTVANYILLVRYGYNLLMAASEIIKNKFKHNSFLNIEH